MAETNALTKYVQKIYLLLQQSEEGKTTGANVPAILSISDTGAITLSSGDTDDKSLLLQNTGIDPIFVRYNGVATSAVFHYVLKGGDTYNDGNGAVASENLYVGSISGAVSTGTTGKIVVLRVI